MSRDADDPISEYAVAPPNFVDGLSVIQTIGSVTHLLFTTRQCDVGNGNRIERTVQVRLVVPTDQLAAIGALMVAGHNFPGAGNDAGEPAAVH